MKTLLSLFVLSILCISCNTKKEDTAQKEIAVAEVVEIATPSKATFITETLELTHCESAVYDKNNDVIYASLIGNRKPGNGSIATVGVDGKLINAQFVAGLNDPKGIAITKDKLYVSDVTELVEADLKTGKVLNTYTAEGIEFLNDVAIAPDGAIYVSDTRTSKIYRLDQDGNFDFWLADPKLDNPNGLLIQGDTMYVASWGGAPEGGRVSKFDMNTKKITSVTDIIGNLDGIRPYDKNHLIISDWRSGKVHLMNFDGTTQEVVTVGQSVGDIAYIKEKNLLLLPMNKQSRLLFYELK
ncbi:ATP/GTP-binding protein [Dokdonia pacifica]|uniref:Sugar lactone lactonase YvrE n=1 Tax=Dokdonia pacifica TaxID=1627892 RepID=A0A238Z889_9FLAO|nr:SMP-30/gluconolactonase/LRE family protein [Dokdonia pacifica]GGG05012.1 ATP/GTP-binding protein [Dokdonia pacifica]SNR79686.1 Sugar lactone lactonase YvrE [Dokdonia pacifica]